MHALRHVKRSLRVDQTVEFTTNLGSNRDPFESIGGNSEAKRALAEAIAIDRQKTELLAMYGMAPPSGVMLYGPPGTGKTLLAKAVASMLNRNEMLNTGGAFISVSTTDVARAEIGTGEKLLVSAFQTARLNAPAVVFIDEFQALFTDRNNSRSGKLTSTLMALMDDCAGWANLEREVNGNQIVHNKRVIVLAATNTPWMVDVAFMRTGRFDRIVHVGLPDLNDRFSILKILLGHMKISFATKSNFFVSFCQHLATETEGYSGADLSALCRSAAILSLVEGYECVDASHFEKSLKGSRPSSDDALVQRLKQWRPI